jgi:tripartite-type tricarboxylate transporter receptor subunit TctC
VHVAYRGGGQAMTGLVSGRIDYSFASAPNALPMIEAGRLRAKKMGPGEFPPRPCLRAVRMGCPG